MNNKGIIYIILLICYMNVNANSSTVSECRFADQTPAPNWVCEPYQDVTSLVVISVVEPSIGGINFQREICKSQGIASLARQVKSHITQNIETKVVRDDKTESTKSTTVTIVRTNVTLKGVRLYKWTVSPSKRMYCLVGMPIRETVTENPPPPPQPECAYPDTPTVPAPEWVCKPSSVTGADFTAVGSGKSQSMFLQKQQCLASARMEMAQMLKTSVYSMFQQYAKITGSGDQETIDQMSKVVTEQLTRATLVGTSLKRVATSPNGTMYCLVAMEISKGTAISDAAKKAANAATKTSQGNQQALWQKFQAQMSLDEMARKIDEKEKNK